MASAEVRQTVFGSGNIFTATGDVRINYQLPQAEAKERRVLLQLTEAVKQFWIAGVLQRSIHEAAMLDLRKEDRPDAVQHPWERVLELPGQPAQPLAVERTIGGIFAETGRALLILGEPGAGKTISLLELARELIERFERDPAQPAPVVLNLSTWDRKRGAFNVWVESELKNKYFVPVRRAREWLSANRLALLLDGLDEVAPEQQGACIQAINRHVESTGSPGIAVCSRLADYVALPDRLRFTGAVCLQPLTAEQIDEFLERGGPQLSALRTVLLKDSLLQELARSPLLLNVLSLAYREVPVEAIADQQGQTVESRRHHLFTHYTNRMFRRVPNTPPEFAEPRTRQWLGWLANRMQEHSLTLFSLEQLQPSWLPSAGDRWRYAFASRIANAFVWCSTIWTISLIVAPAWRALWLRGTFLLVLAVLTAGGLQGLVDGRRLIQAPRPRGKLFAFFAVTGLSVLHAVVMTLVFGMISAAFLPPIDPEILKQLGAAGWTGWFPDAAHGFRTGAFMGLVFGFRYIRVSPTNDIRLAETLRLSRASAWKGAKRSGLVGMIVGAIAVVAFLANEWAEYAQYSMWIIAILVGIGVAFVGFLFAIMGAAFGMFAPGDLPVKMHPGRWVRRSVQNALVAGIVVFFAFALVFMPWVIGSHDITIVTLNFLTCCGAGVAAAMWYGGFDAVQHTALRFMLRRRGLIPKDLVRFLDHATRLIFLQKVGAGYLFVHRQLLEFFSGATRPPALATTATTIPPR